MGKPARVSPVIFLLVILLVATGETAEARTWWKKVGDSIGHMIGGVGSMGKFKTVVMGLSITGGSCVRELMSVSTNVFSEWCIALNDPRAPMYMNIEKIPGDVSIESILKMPVDFLQKNYPNFLKAWRFNQENKKKHRRAL